MSDPLMEKGDDNEADGAPSDSCRNRVSFSGDYHLSGSSTSMGAEDTKPNASDRFHARRSIFKIAASEAATTCRKPRPTDRKGEEGEAYADGEYKELDSVLGRTWYGCRCCD